MKYLTATYLKKIKKYKLSMFIEEEDCIIVKKILEINKPFILKEENKNITIIDNGYYILEYMPFNENYICRVHIDKYKNVIERFYTAPKITDITQKYETYTKHKTIIVWILVIILFVIMVAFPTNNSNGENTNEISNQANTIENN